MIRHTPLPCLIFACLTPWFGHSVIAEKQFDICSWSQGDSLLRQNERSCPPPIDQEAAQETEEWAPWSHPPYCVHPENEPRSSPPYCVFSADYYRGGHGASVITTPYLAATIADSLDDGTLPPDIRDHPSSSLADQNGSGPAFRIQDLPGKGKGAIATRSIPRWSVAMVDHPVIIAKMDFWEALGPDQIRAVLQRAIHQLPSETQETVMSLDRSTGGGLVQDILNTNIFGIELDGVMHMGLYPLASRTNHNCRPNAFWRYSKDTLAMEVVAIHDIEPGEEITHSYDILGRTYKERQEALKDGWGFTCRCPLCSSSRRTIQQSDRRRERIRKIRSLFNTRDDLSRDRVDKLADEMLRLVSEEKLELQLVTYYEVIARAYMGVLDFERAREYATMSEDAWIRYGGKDHDNVEGIRQLWQDLEEML